LVVGIGSLVEGIEILYLRFGTCLQQAGLTFGICFLEFNFLEFSA
jgi:hypothetical protein